MDTSIFSLRVSPSQSQEKSINPNMEVFGVAQGSLTSIEGRQVGQVGTSVKNLASSSIKNFPSVISESLQSSGAGAAREGSKNPKIISLDRGDLETLDPVLSGRPAQKCGITAGSSLNGESAVQQNIDDLDPPAGSGLGLQGVPIVISSDKGGQETSVQKFSAPMAQKCRATEGSMPALIQDKNSDLSILDPAAGLQGEGQSHSVIANPSRGDPQTPDQEISAPQTFCSVYRRLRSLGLRLILKIKKFSFYQKQYLRCRRDWVFQTQRTLRHFLGSKSVQLSQVLGKLRLWNQFLGNR